MIQVEEVDNNFILVTQRRADKFALNNSYKPIAKPSGTKVKQFMSVANWLQPWGSDNLWPITVKNALNGCAPAQVCIEILTTLFYGNGLRVYTTNADGSVVAGESQQQLEWFEQTNIEEYLQQAAADYFTHGNQFAQLIRNGAKTGVGYLANISAPFCRLGRINPDDGSIPNVLIYGSWENLPGMEVPEKVPLLPRMDAADVFKNSSAPRMMWHTKAYTPGVLDYHDQPWHALVKNGTLDIFPEIPKIRKNRVKNAMFIKYHIRINEMFWHLRAGGEQKWNALSTAERNKMRTDFYQQIEDRLAGSDQSFKSIFSGTWTTPQGAEIKLLQIEKIETEVGEKAAFDPDKMSNVADIFLAFGIPSAVANTVLSDNKSRGGGSDIREGNSLVLTRMPMHRANILKPVTMAMRLNNMLLPNQFLGMENTILTTLDKSSNGTTTVNPQIPAA